MKYRNCMEKGNMPELNSLKPFEDAPQEENLEHYMWVCPECSRTHGYWDEECSCMGRLYPQRIDRSHIAKGYAVEEL